MAKEKKPRNKVKSKSRPAEESPRKGKRRPKA